MKHILKSFLLGVVLLMANSAHAVFVDKMPIDRIQPNGDTVHMFVTGDEYYHRYHDANDFTIVQNQAGYWVYAQADKASGVKPSAHIVGSVNPATIGLTPGLRISKSEYQERMKMWEIPEQYRKPEAKTEGVNHGDFTNLVVFLRFSDDSNYSRPLSSVDRMFSDSSHANSTSVYNYFRKASYGKISIRTYYAPTPDSNVIISFQDSHPRAYYEPYSEANPIGYTNRERNQREFDLLENAINWINANSPVPTSYNLDCNGDGEIDNVNFVVRGATGNWNDLLWPHKFNLYDRQVYLNGKRINTFNLAIEGAGDDYFGSSTFSHELFHSLGAPDLYHYGTGTEISPVGIWDLMATNQKPQQHSTAWIKYRYGNWLDSIPLITTPGVYTLSSMADSVPGTMALRFPSADPDQFYVVEYRDNTETFETKLPGKGLIVYRVDTREHGNSNWDGVNGFNEIWVFRPGSHSDDESGSLAEAYLTPARNRTEFSPATPDFYPYLSDGTRDYTFSIVGVSNPGSTCSFRYTNHTAPADLKNMRITTSTATLTWQGIGEAYSVYYRLANSDDEYRVRTVNSNSITLTGLEHSQTYEWHVRALYDLSDAGNYCDSSKASATLNFHTQTCNNATTDTIGWYTTDEHLGVPFANNQNYNYAQIIYPARELSGAKSINSISLHYAYTTQLVKTNCTIYLANTTMEYFDDSATLVPTSELTTVYVGDLKFDKGWNEIILQTPFDYNGVDNLLVAIDDNSGTPARAGQKFYTNEASQKVSLVYSNNTNIGPEQDSITGTRNRTYTRPNIKFSGCPIDPEHVYACVISNNETMGRVTGEGLYDVNSTITIQAFPKTGNYFIGWLDGNTDNPREIMLTNDTIFVAMFSNTVGINDVETPAGFVVLTQQQRITIQGAEGQPIRVFDILGRPISRADAHHDPSYSLTLPHRGVYIICVGNQAPVKILVN